ncbi:MAG: hypothetical protein RBU37_03860 [Myxococcota bacterium]|jgi:hypothetical protein|nr:hypothetical protein [Myxococcota bacterium]
MVSRCVGILLWCLVLGACESPPKELAPSEAAVEPQPESGCSDARIESLATRYCRLTQGGVPLWPVFAEASALLREEERQLAEWLAAEADAAFSPSERPRAWAIAAFLSELSECKVVAVKRDQQTGGTGQAPNRQEMGGTGQAPNRQRLVAVALEQRTPLLREPSEHLPFREGMEQSARIRLWRQAFERAFDGQYSETVVALRLIEDGEQCWVDAQLDTRFARPLKRARRFDELDKAVLEHDWAKTRALLDELCVEEQGEQRCSTAQKRWELAQEHQKQLLGALPKLRVVSHQSRGLAQGDGHVMAYVVVDLEYDGEQALSSLWMQVEDSAARRQRCALYQGAPPSLGSLLKVAPGARLRGYCVLEDAPVGELEVSVFDAVPELAAEP